MNHSEKGSPGQAPASGPLPTEPKAGAQGQANSTVSKNSAQSSRAPDAADTVPASGMASAGDAAGVKPAAGALFSKLSHIGPLLLLFFLSCQAWPDFWQALLGKAYYCPAEVNTIAALLETMASGEWLKPETTALASIPWPGYIWFNWLLAPLSMMFFHSQAMLFPIASTLAAALALLAAWGLAICIGAGSRAAFAAGLILLCSPIFVPLAHFSGGAALAAAFIMLSLLLFFIGWQAKHSFICLPLAFICAGLAGLCGGLFHLLLPLLTSLIFIIWCGKFRRAHNLDAIIGFLLLLILLCGWFAAIILTTPESDYLASLVSNLVRPAWEEPDLFFMPALVAGIGLLPWLIMVFCVSWHKLFPNILTALRLSRKENAGSSLIWIAIFCGIALSFFSPDRQIQPTAVALACLAAILLGRSFLRLSDTGVRVFYLLTGLTLFIGGLALLALHFSFSQELLLGILPFEVAEKYRSILLGLPAIPVIAGICVVASLLLIRFIIANRHGNGLIYSTLVVIALCQPVCLMLVPELAATHDVPLCLYDEIREKADGHQAAGAGVAAPALPVPGRNNDIQDDSASDTGGTPIVGQNPQNGESAESGENRDADHMPGSAEDEKSGNAPGGENEAALQ